MLASTLLCLAPALADPLQGSPLFRVYELPLSGRGVQVVTAPLDAGPTPDALVLSRLSDTQAAVLALRGTGTGRLVPTGERMLDLLGYADDPTLALADLNGDPLPDFAVTQATNGQIFLGQGQLNFDVGGQLFTGGGAQLGLDFSDVNADGNEDAVLVVDDLALFFDIGLGDGAGGFPSFTTITPPGFPNALGTPLLQEDFDGDGLVSSFLLTGVGLQDVGWPDSDSGGPLLIPGKMDELISGHLNTDSFLDLAVADAERGGVHVLRGDGTGSFPQITFQPTGGAPVSVAAGDMDLDGRPDLIVALPGQNGLRVLRNTGGGYTPLVDIPVAADPRDVEAVDLDADGDLDLVVACGTSNALSVVLSRLVP